MEVSQIPGAGKIGQEQELDAGLDKTGGRSPDDAGIDELSRKFKDTLQDKNAGKKSEKNTEPKKDSRKSSQKLTPGDVQLQAMQQPQEAAGMANMQGLESSAKTSQQSEISSELTDIVNQIAVRCDASIGKREVHMQIESPHFPETSVKIERLHGELQIQFSTSSGEAKENLATAQADLHDRLTSKLGEDVRISVVSSGMQQSGGGDSNNGRSRQQRSLAEEADYE